MPIRKLLLPMAGTVAGESALLTTLRVAQRWSAHVVAMHVRMDSRDVAPLAGEGLSGAMIEEMMSATEHEAAERAAAVRGLFERFTVSHGVEVRKASGRQDRASAEFVVMVGREDEVVAQQARLADMTVVAHPEAEEEASSSDALHAVLFDSGRPVLIAPHTPPETIGTRVAIGWNGTAESAAAISAALPWLQRADAVRILSAEGYQRRGPSAAELAAYLTLHGIRAEVAQFRPVDNVVGAGLLAAAVEFGADLLTLGAYSHSRLRQLILGGVTRHVLAHARLPVLMNR